MLRNAPKFYEVAKRIVEITEDCIIVAHNAQFDYRILCTEFKRLSFQYERQTLCTVELSKELIPDQTSYSLGKLVRALGIPVTDRHRASGDALATIKLFKILLSKDSDKKIIQEAIRLNPKRQLEPRHIDIIEKLPSETGVYYIHKEDGEIIYIGKSKNIKHRINKHFTGTNPKSKKIQALVASVTYEVTGSELVALLKESEEIKRIGPIFNRALKRTLFSHALYSSKDLNNYITLSINKVDNRKKHITSFANIQSAKSFMHKAVEDFKLCQKLTGLYKTESSCFEFDIKECEGACIQKEIPELYNKRVQLLLDKNRYNKENMVILDKGRDIDERSAILIENGIFIGLGFFNLNYQINNLDVLKSIITPMSNNRDTQHIIQSYLRKNKRTKIVQFN